MLLLDATGLQGRRAAARGEMAPLAQSLAADLEKVMSRPVFIPPEKAKLTRIGGRCGKDGMMLTFDPFEPHEHECPRCHTRYREGEHYRWWIMSYQLWLAERAVHAATLHALLGDARHRAFAEEILTRYALSYASYPNSDNVLGPSRLFFSTYLESLWLLEICVALDMLELASGTSSLTRTLRSAILDPATELIGGYDEGDSNRQVWNNAALLAAARLLGDHDMIDATVNGYHGVAGHLDRALLADGTWYEGENYHQFAHRGLWYGVTLAERAGVSLPSESMARFQEGFATPFLSVLPDFTFPARRDSPHRVSLRQWRYAESCELGLARANDDRLIGALHSLYNDDVPSGDTGRARSAGESERNELPVKLTRADLGWRSLLHARPALPELRPVSAGSVVLEQQGLAVFRRDRGRLYAALDYGHSGGGHGHPDRLNILLIDGEQRWLDDSGTGSYVDPALHWYRSTLAHNAPMIGGHSQPREDGILLAHDERGAAGWVRAAVMGLARTAAVERTLVVMPDYVVDRLGWTSENAEWIDLPLHVDADAPGIEWMDAKLQGGHALEDGFAFVRSAKRARATTDPIKLTARAASGASLDLWILSAIPLELWRVIAPGAPGEGECAFVLLRARANNGSIALVWSPRAAVSDVRTAEGGQTVMLSDGSRHEHRMVESGWHVELHAGGARSSIDLEGLRGQRVMRVRTTVTRSSDARLDVPLRRGAAGTPRDAWFRETPAIVRDRLATIELGELHYRRSELPWREAGAPKATVVIGADEGRLLIEINVRKREPVFAPARESNPLDNERADINSDGVQLYLLVPDTDGSGIVEGGSWLMVPNEDGTVRVTSLGAWDRSVPLNAQWKRMYDGYVIRAAVELGARAVRTSSELLLEVIVNDISRDRERRRGQLLLSGGRGEFIYLQGDRHSGRWMTLRING